jgi:DNA replication initiation complex subunit (GINS family)
MSDNEEKLDVLFYQLVLSMQANAWTQMGKTASPLTGKMERNLEQAKFSIDMLEMIQRKTLSNLTDDEKKLLEHTLFELRMNYIDEVKKDQEKKDEDKSEESKEETEEPKVETEEETANKTQDEEAGEKDKPDDS